MYFHFCTVITFAALLFLVGAVPVSPISSRVKGPISLPLTKYSNHMNRDGHVDPRKVQAGVDQTMAKYDQAFSEHEKRTGEIHPLALKRRHSNKRRSFVSNSLTLSTNALLLGVSVGTPPVEYNVQLDTFTSNMFLCGVFCLTCFEHKRYNGSQSSTPLDQVQGTLNFSLGSVTGNNISDQVSVGNFHVLQQMIVATKIDIPLQATSFLGDGSMGLGLNNQSWFGRLIQSNVLAQEKLDQVFGISFAEAGSSPGPQFIIGGTDNTKLVDQLTNIKVPENATFWQIPLNSVIVNGNDIEITNKDAIIDLGSAVVAGDSGDIANLHRNIPGSAQVPNSDQWTVPCNASVDVVFGFGGKKFTIPPRAYILGPVSQGVDSTDGTCMSGFSSGSDGFWVVGIVFMQTVYTQFNQVNLEIGFGVAVSA